MYDFWQQVEKSMLQMDWPYIMYDDGRMEVSCGTVLYHLGESG